MQLKKYRPKGAYNLQRALIPTMMSAILAFIFFEINFNIK